METFHLKGSCLISQVHPNVQITISDLGKGTTALGRRASLPGEVHLYCLNLWIATDLDPDPCPRQRPHPGLGLGRRSSIIMHSG